MGKKEVEALIDKLATSKRVRDCCKFGKTYSCSCYKKEKVLIGDVLEKIFWETSVLKSKAGFKERRKIWHELKDQLISLWLECGMDKSLNEINKDLKVPHARELFNFLAQIFNE